LSTSEDTGRLPVIAALDAVRQAETALSSKVTLAELVGKALPAANAEIVNPSSSPLTAS
jgi:hypothetical protein